MKRPAPKQPTRKRPSVAETTALKNKLEESNKICLEQAVEINRLKERVNGFIKDKEDLNMDNTKKYIELTAKSQEYDVLQKKVTAAKTVIEAMTVIEHDSYIHLNDGSECSISSEPDSKELKTLKYIHEILC